MSSEILNAIARLEEEKGISREVLIEAIEAALVSAYKRNFNQAQNVRTISTWKRVRCMFTREKKWWKR